MVANYLALKAGRHRQLELSPLKRKGVLNNEFLKKKFA